MLNQFLDDIRIGNTVLLLDPTLTVPSEDSFSLTLCDHESVAGGLLEAFWGGLHPPDRIDTSTILQRARAIDSTRADDVLRRAYAEATPSAEHLAVLARLVNGPWRRVYDLSGNPCFSSVCSGHKNLVLTNASRDPAVSQHRLQVVQLFGSGGQPDTVDFSSTARGRGPRDVWLGHFAADVLTHPVVLVAGPDGPDAATWRLLEDRSSSDNCPPGYLVSPSADSVHSWFLDGARLSWISVDTPRFVDDYLRPSHHQVHQARISLSRYRSTDVADAGIGLVASKLRDEQRDRRPEDFLRGFDPAWEDIYRGRPCRLDKLDQLKALLQDVPNRQPMTLVMGRAGSGKTTLLMQVAQDLVRSNQTVGWVDRDATVTVGKIVDQAIELNLDAIIIDDIDIFGHSSGRLMRQLNRSGRTLVLASVRSTRLHVVHPEGAVQRFESDQKLVDADFSSIIKKLTEFGLLGTLQGKPTPLDRKQALVELSNGDLLAGLIQVVTGVEFSKRIASELRQVPAPGDTMYAAICLVHQLFEHPSLNKEDLLQIVGKRPPFGQLAASLDALIDQRLVVFTEDGYLRSRHRAVADLVVERLSEKPEILHRIVENALSFYARRSAARRNTSHPDHRMAVRLMSHTFLRELNLDRRQVRSIYATVQDELSGDFHYWLQRGAYELEESQMEFARSYLSSARSLPNGAKDSFVTTEWGLLCLKSATNDPTDTQAASVAVAAFRDMETVARRHRADSPHTFTVMAREGYAWLASEPPISPTDYEDLSRTLEEIIQLGKEACQDNEKVVSAVRSFGPRVARLIRQQTESYPI